MRILSDTFFWIASGTLLIAIILFESGTRYMRKGENDKREKIDKIAWKFLAVAGILYGLSFLTGL